MGLAVLVSPPAIACLALLAMLGLSLRSLRLYARRAPEIRSQLKRIDRDLAKYQEMGMVNKKKAVADLEQQLAPLQSTEAALRAYFDELGALLQAAEKEALAREQAAHPSRNLEIKIKKPGS